MTWLFAVYAAGALVMAGLELFPPTDIAFVARAMLREHFLRRRAMHWFYLLMVAGAVFWPFVLVWFAVCEATEEEL